MLNTIDSFFSSLKALNARSVTVVLPASLHITVISDDDVANWSKLFGLVPATRQDTRASWLSVAGHINDVYVVVSGPDRPVVEAA